MAISEVMVNTGAGSLPGVSGVLGVPVSSEHATNAKGIANK
jgi:hypothetical protein